MKRKQIKNRLDKIESYLERVRIEFDKNYADASIDELEAIFDSLDGADDEIEELTCDLREYYKRP